MKIRKGFVSNSSSTSFTVFVKNKNILHWSDLPQWLKDNDFNSHDLWVLKYICGADGDWCKYHVDKEFLDLLIKYSYKNWSDLLILVDPVWTAEGNDFFGFQKLSDAVSDIDDFVYGNFEVDYHGFEDLSDWIDVFEDRE